MSSTRIERGASDRCSTNEVGSPAPVRLHARPAFVLAVALVAFLDGAALHASPADDMRVPEDVRSISYFPALGGWTLMWTRFDADAIDRDLTRIAWLRANTVRVIVPARVFGYPEPEAEMSARLERIVDLAARHGLRVELTMPINPMARPSLSPANIKAAA